MIYQNYADDCSHASIRNEMAVDPTNVKFTGKMPPWGGFYGSITCPDCERDLRFRAEITSVWPADWKVQHGVPVDPDGE